MHFIIRTTPIDSIDGTCHKLELKATEPIQPITSKVNIKSLVDCFLLAIPFDHHLNLLKSFGNFTIKYLRPLMGFYLKIHICGKPFSLDLPLKLRSYNYEYNKLLFYSIVKCYKNKPSK